MKRMILKVIGVNKGWENPVDRKIFAIRTLLICSFVAAAVTCTTLAYTTLHEFETKYFENKFDSVSSSALSSVEGSFNHMNTGAQILSNTFSDLFPTAEMWPNVACIGFHPLASLLGPVSAMNNMAVLPLVRPHEISSFERFMNDFYDDNYYVKKDQFHHPAFPNVTVWAQDFNDPDALPYRDSTGVVPFSSKAILTPVVQYTTSTFFGPFLGGYNVHSDPLTAGAIDKAIDCVAAENRSASTLSSSSSCGMLSEVLAYPYRTASNPNPELEDMVALTIFPIFPHHNQTVLTGFAGGGISWRKLLTNVVPQFVGDVDCVVRTQTSVFTMRIHLGVPHMVGLGDHRERKFSEFGASSTLGNTGVSLTFYPTQDFADEYITDDPLCTALTLLGVFFLCASLFYFYDLLMHREFGRKQAVLDTKRRFVRFISHEIRTPLNTVRLGLKLFETELKKLLVLFETAPAADLSTLITSTVKNWTQLTQDILISSESAVEVLNDLLNYDKIEMGTLRLEFALLNIGDLIQRTVSIMQLEAQQKDISLEVEMCTTSSSDQSAAPLEDSCMVGDKGRLAQVLRNLVSNALKFTPTGGSVRLSVKLEDCLSMDTPLRTQEQAELYAAHPATGLIAVSVTDSGAGLSPEQLAEICSEGVQFNANELQAGQGSGLGLFISKGIVEQHGGKLTVTSEGVGKGATFTVELPRVQAKCDYKGAIATLANKKSAPRAKSTHHFLDPHTRCATDLTSPPGSPSTSMVRKAGFPTIIVPKRLLVVDDSHFNRKMLTRLLTSKDYLCEQAEDGAQAIEMYTAMCERGDVVDAILMDFEMPVMNGPTATKRLREMGCTCLIVGVTGNVLPDEIEYFKLHGVDAVLPKPLVLEDFERLFADHLDAVAGPALLSKPRAAILPPVPAALSTSRVHPVQNV